MVWFVVRSAVTARVNASIRRSSLPASGSHSSPLSKLFRRVGLSITKQSVDLFDRLGRILQRDMRLDIGQRLGP